MGAAEKGVGERGRGHPDFRNVTHGSCTGSLIIWFGDVRDVPTHWEDFGQLPQQGVPQTEWTATA